MTIIAYRDGILAADTLSTCYGTRSANVLKIERVKDWLIGGAGSFGVIVPVKQWILAGADLTEAINFGKIEDSGCLMIACGSGELFYAHTGSGYVLPETAPFAAMGSGTDIALGAMYMGATALQAVEAAKSLETSCGGSAVWLDIWGQGELELKKEIYNPGN